MYTFSWNSVSDWFDKSNIKRDFIPLCYVSFALWLFQPWNNSQFRELWVFLFVSMCSRFSITRTKSTSIDIFWLHKIIIFYFSHTVLWSLNIFILSCRWKFPFWNTLNSKKRFPENVLRSHLKLWTCFDKIYTKHVFWVRLIILEIFSNQPLFSSTPPPSTKSIFS